MEELNNIIQEISQKIIDFNQELKKGNYNNLKTEVDIILENIINFKIPGIKVVDSPFHGKNIEFNGVNSNFLFPFILYSNTFRIQILKDLNNFIRRDYTLDELGIFLSTKIQSTIDSKKGGFNERTLELLRFYLLSYDKILDNSMEKYKPLLNNYTPKYHILSKEYLKTRFPLTQKYIKTYLVPNFHDFSISSLLLEYNKDYFNDVTLDGVPLGILHDNKKDKKFILLETVSGKNIFKNNVIRKITFFENLDLFYKHSRYFRFRNKINNIFSLYEDYKEEIFKNTAKDYEINFLYKKGPSPLNNYDLEALVHIFTTRKIPLDFEIHSTLKNYIYYRNKVATFYSSTNYFIHIFDPKNKNLDQYSEIISMLLKNSFSNGFIINYKTGFLLSTNAFREDFDRVKKEFQEFIWSFKLDCTIYDNLNYIPFSFYRLPNSQYYSNETNHWNFPVFEDKPVQEYFDHLAVNYKQEIKRLEDASFKTRVDQTVERLTKEITEIKEQQKKEQLEKQLVIEN